MQDRIIHSLTASVFGATLGREHSVGVGGQLKSAGNDHLLSPQDSPEIQGKGLDTQCTPALLTSPAGPLGILTLVLLIPTFSRDSMGVSPWFRETQTRHPAHPGLKA